MSSESSTPRDFAKNASRSGSRTNRGTGAGIPAEIIETAGPAIAGMAAMGYTSYLGVPLISKGRRLGTVCGFNMQGAGTTGGFFPDRVTGLEARFIAEVSAASLGLTRQDAAQLVQEILPHYQATITSPNRGRPFNEVYNVETVQPTTEWLDMYYAVKEDLRRMGLKLA